jgi:hypothetical protein
MPVLSLNVLVKWRYAAEPALQSHLSHAQVGVGQQFTGVTNAQFVH